MPLEHYTDLESFVQDASDPVQFVEAFFQVQRPDEFGYKPIVNYKYINEYMRDQSDMKVTI